MSGGWAAFAQLFMAAGGGAVLLALVNAWFNRASRKADPARQLVEGSVAHNAQLIAENTSLRRQRDEAEHLVDEKDILLGYAFRYIETLRTFNSNPPHMPDRLWKAYQNRP